MAGAFVAAMSLLPLLMLPCTAQSSAHPLYKPLVAPLAKDPGTSLYTISIKKDAPLVVDLAGTLIWSTCPRPHRTLSCSSDECAAAKQDSPQRCPYVDSRPDANHCTCTAHPYNPVTGQCGAGDFTSFAMSANATDGRNPLYPVSFSAVGACAPNGMLRSLPAGATGVAGLSERPLSLPSQLAKQRKFGNRFAICLPGVAIFGNTTIYIPYYPIELTTTIASTPLLKNPKNGAYYLPVEGISIYWGETTPVPMPGGALDIDAGTGRGGVAMSTVAPYAEMRPDVYRPFVQAYDAVMRSRSYVVRMPAAGPFEMCYDRYTLRRLKRTGYDAPAIQLELGPGATRNWTVSNGNSLVEVGERAVCLAFVQMATAGGDGEPAVVIGGFQLEDNLLVFDVDKGVLAFSGLLWGSGATCSSFNFTMSR